MTVGADWVFHSGRIFDGSIVLAQATAVAVRAGRIAAVGSESEVRQAVGRATEVVDLAGRMLSPGFTDAHVHTVMGGVERLACDLSLLSGAPAALERIAEYAAGSDAGWITGGGWYKGDYPGGYPHRSMLDAVVADRPVYLINRDHHSAWVNSRALELAGIDVSTRDPADGRIERDSDGVPTGTLHEGAMDLVSRLLPPLTQATLVDGLLAGQQYLHSVGVTGWQEAILGDYAGYPEASAAYRQLAAEGRLTGRATGALWVPRSTTADTIDALVSGFVDRRQENLEAGFLTTSAKIMVDGVPENYTAAMLDPYLSPCSCDGGHSTSSAERGLTYLPQDVLEAVCAALDAAGFDLHLHVIGDRAVRNGLDAIAHTLRSNGARGARHHMAHVQIVHPADISRFAELDVTVNAQTLWACRDEQMRELTIPLIGAERAQWQYPFASLIGRGAALAMGSDWPVSSPDPWQAIHVAVNRTHPRHGRTEPLVPTEALSLETALRAYTAGSARLNRFDGGGMILPGAPADVVVLGTDPFGLDATELHTVGVDLTMAGGRIVHAAPGQGE